MLRIKWIGIYCGILLATTLLFTACGSTASAPSNNTGSAAEPTKAEEPTATAEPTMTPEASTAMTATTATTTTEEMTATATMTTAETAPATTSAMTSTETMTTTESMTATSTMTTSGAMTETNEEAGMVFVKVAEDPRLGKILVDSKGMTLYLFDKDTAGKSNCSGNCIKNWPALTVKDEDEKLTPGENVTAKLEVIDRGDGTYQVTANGMPLYYYAKDANVGDTTGQGVGDVWWVLSPDGTKVSTK